MPQTSPIRTLIMGAAGRDFHNFNLVFRDDPTHEVVAFTAAQIPDIAGRVYPPALAGSRYPDGIPILDEAQLAELCRELQVQKVVFAYSDVSHDQVMHSASIALAAGADFVLLGPERTMLRAGIPVIAVSAVRTGCGKSQTSRWLSRLLRDAGLATAVIRHPMPYGNLERQAVQCFTSRGDLLRAACSVEEREEYEPHLALGNPVYAGVDYRRILDLAQRDSQLILWDGGNNDFPFIRPDLHIVLVDPLRPGHEASHHPGEAVLRMADIVVISKVNSAAAADIQRVTENVRRINPSAALVHAASPVQMEESERVQGKRVLVVEDGPSITHGGMPYGAGYVAATRTRAGSIVDPRPYAVGGIAQIYRQYPHIGPVLPALGYHPAQLEELRATIAATQADLVVAATPCELGALIEIDQPVIFVRYEYAEAGEPGLGSLVREFLENRGLLPGTTIGGD